MKFTRNTVFRIMLIVSIVVLALALTGFAPVQAPDPGSPTVAPLTLPLPGVGGITFSPEEVAAVFGIVLSLIFSRAPKVRKWYEALDPDEKQYWALGILFVGCVIMFGASCAGYGYSGLCNGPGLKTLFSSFVVAVIGNAGTYTATRKIFPA